MDIKNWEEYTYEEKRTILDFWFSKYLTMTITLEEWNVWLRLLDYEIDRVFGFAIGTYRNGFGPDMMLMQIRTNCFKDLLNIYNNCDYELLSNAFLSRIVSDYNKRFERSI